MFPFWHVPQVFQLPLHSWQFLYMWQINQAPIRITLFNGKQECFVISGKLSLYLGHQLPPGFKQFIKSNGFTGHAIKMVDENTKNIFLVWCQ